ncbi:LOW QUALITY PROTEIN: girdin-like [Anarrhichthys ocellatus]|uniref:LOW QUALITY PROTEIN: girdin-like n=1 Tax=Anarrhichthys ocellatus TaxID=433405 RepID=UPI0012EEE103|nr:LOW QUALITY PROTEIN: girdin-like [Anarrhichthys ocellatus]
MEDIIGSTDKERLLYLRQIQYLEEQLERCNLKYDELEKQNGDRTSRYGSLEKDKKNTTKNLKGLVVAKEKKVEELTEQLKSQPEANGLVKEALELQHSEKMEELQQRLDEHNSESEMLAAKSRKQQELEEQLSLVMQQQSDTETQTKLLVSQNEKLKANIDRQKNEDELERQKLIAEEKKLMDDFIEWKTLRILRKERDAHSKWLEQLSFLQKENETLPVERDALRDKDRDLCVERDQLTNDLMRVNMENSTCRKELQQMKMACEQLKAELKDCSSAHKSVLARKDSLRRLLASESEEIRQKTVESAELRAELQRESISRRRQLEAVTKEGVLLLGHILTDSDETPETDRKMLRLQEILESSAPQAPPSTTHPSTETSDLRPPNQTGNCAVRRRPAVIQRPPPLQTAEPHPVSSKTDECGLA